MEKMSKKPVDRQATFDVDQGKTTKVSLKHPVIDSLYEKHQCIKESKQQAEQNHYSLQFASDSHKLKPSESNDVNRIVNSDFRDKSLAKTVLKAKRSNNTQCSESRNVTKSNTDATTKDSNGKKYVRDENKHDATPKAKKDFDNLKPLTNTNVKRTDVSGISTDSTDSSAKVKSLKQSPRKLDDQSNLVTAFDTSENKTRTIQRVSNNNRKHQPSINASGAPATQSNNTNSVVTNSIVTTTNSSVKTGETASVNPQKSSNDQRSIKASILKGINLKQNISPVKEDIRTTKETQSTKSDAAKTVANDQLKSPILSKVTANVKTDIVGQNSKATLELKSEERQIEGKKVSNKKSNEITVADKYQEQNVINNKNGSLPSNNAPVETKLRVAETSLANSIKEKIKIEKVKHISKEEKTSPLNLSEPLSIANSAPNKISDDFKGSTIKNYRLKRYSDEQQAAISSRTEEQYTIKHLTEAKISETADIRSLGKQSKPTYVISPSPTKIESTSTLYLKPGRLSPSNQTIEPIHIEQRSLSEKQIMDGRRETYEQVFAERNTLLKAEIAYKKRIKQLEDEANGFLKAIEELTNDNMFMRKKIDTLENEMNGKTDKSAIERVFHLENEKKELEYRVKQFEKIVQSTTAANDNVYDMHQLKEQVVNLKTENQKVTSENIKLKQENDERNVKMNDLENRIKALSVGSQSVESSDVTHENEYTKLNRQLKELKLKNADLQKKVNVLEYENKTLSDLLTHKKTELEEMLIVMKSENRFDDEIKDLKNNILKLNKDKKELETLHLKERRVLNEKLEEVKSALDIKLQNHDELKIKHDELESENAKLKLEHNPLRKLTESQKKEIKQLKEENERLRKELRENSEMHNESLKETAIANKNLKEAKLQLETINNDLQNIVTDKEGQISKLIKQLDTVREDRETERKIAKEDKERLTTETEKVDTYEKNIKKMESDIKYLAEKVEQNKLNEKHMSLQLEDKTFQVTNLEQQVFEMNMKLDNYSKRMSELDRVKREIERDKRDWEVKKDKLDDIEASNKRLLDENKRLRSQLEANSYQTDYKPPQQQPPALHDQPVIEAWISDKLPMQNSNQIAIYVQRQKHKDRNNGNKTNQQHSVQKKRLELSKSSSGKPSEQKSPKQDGDTSQNNTHRSLEDLRKTSKSPDSEHSLPELQKDARLTVGFVGLGGYREIHKDRIKAASKRVF